MLFDENGIICIQSGSEEKKDGRRNLFGTGTCYINLGNVFAECVHFLFS